MGSGKPPRARGSGPGRAGRRPPGAGGAGAPGRRLRARGGGLHLAAAPRPEGRGPASRQRWRLLAPGRALPGVRRTREAGRARAPAAEGGGRRRGGWPRARWRRGRPEPRRSGERERGGGRGRRRGARAAFPIPNSEPRVCRWGCSAAPAAEGEQRRRAAGSGGGGAKAAEVRAGELPGAPRHSGNGLAARRGRAGAPCCWWLRATRGPRPAPPPPHLGSGGGPGRRGRRGLLRAPGPAGVERAPSPGSALLGCGLEAGAAGARRRVSPGHAAGRHARRSPQALGQAGGAGRGPGARGPARPAA